MARLNFVNDFSAYNRLPSSYDMMDKRVNNILTDIEKVGTNVGGLIKENEMNELRNSINRSNASKKQNEEWQKELEALQGEQDVEDRRRKYMVGGAADYEGKDYTDQINNLKSNIDLNNGYIITDDDALDKMAKLAQMGDSSLLDAYRQRLAEKQYADQKATQEKQLEEQKRQFDIQQGIAENEKQAKQAEEDYRMSLPKAKKEFRDKIAAIKSMKENKKPLTPERLNEEIEKAVNDMVASGIKESDVWEWFNSDSDMEKMYGKAVYDKNNPKPAKNYPTDIAGIKPEWEGHTRIILGKKYTSVTNPNGSLGWKEVK